MARFKGRVLFLLSTLSLLASGHVEASCASTTPGTTRGNNIHVLAGSGVSSTLLNDAINKWETGCSGSYGSGFPAFNSGGAGIRYTARRQAVNLTGGDCGRIGGDTITIYESSKPNGPSGPTVSCGDMASVLAHELGHALRLNDAGPGCSDHIMATDFNPSTVRTVKPAECSAADGRWETTHEIVIPNPDDDCNPAQDPDCLGSPLVFDLLNTGGIKATNRRAPRVPFDIDGDVRRESTQWVDARGGDAFLWLDLDQDGEVDGGKELFGDATILPNGFEAEHGFEALAVHDGDGDGAINSQDSVWASLKLWTDADMDGRVGRGEWRTLDDAGVTRISLQFEERKPSTTVGTCIDTGERTSNAPRVGKCVITSWSMCSSCTGNSLPGRTSIATDPDPSSTEWSNALTLSWPTHRTVDPQPGTTETFVGRCRWVSVRIGIRTTARLNVFESVFESVPSACSMPGCASRLRDSQVGRRNDRVGRGIPRAGHRQPKVL